MQGLQNQCNMEDEDKLNLEHLDFSLVEATLQSIQTRTLTPIIKEELKLKIQTQRLAQGKRELPKPEFKEPETVELTAEDEARRSQRREANKRAANKCRNKRKLEFESIKTLKAELEVRNYSLKQQVIELEKEKARVIENLRHRDVDVQNAGEGPELSTVTNAPTDGPMVFIEETAAEYPEQSSSDMCVPSTSTGIRAFDLDHPSRRHSAEAYRPPPPYQPRRLSGDIPFSRYMDFDAQLTTSCAQTSVHSPGSYSHAFMDEATTFTAPYSEYQGATSPVTCFPPSFGCSSTAPDVDLLADDELSFMENQSMSMYPFLTPVSEREETDTYHSSCNEYHMQSDIQTDGHVTDAKQHQQTCSTEARGDLNEEIRLLEEFFIPVPMSDDGLAVEDEEATVPGGQNTPSQRLTTPTFYP